MIVRQIVAAAALALSAVAAHAAPFTIGQGSADSLTGLFSVNYDLTAPGSFSLNALAEEADDTITSFQVFDGSTEIFADVTNSNSTAYALSFYSLSAGTYTFKVQAAPSAYVVITGSVGPEYTVPSTPVPEPESYALAIAGLGVLGMMARRRVRA